MPVLKLHYGSNGQQIICDQNLAQIEIEIPVSVGISNVEGVAGHVWLFP